MEYLLFIKLGFFGFYIKCVNNGGYCSKGKLVKEWRN